ncbi:MAG: hypothetical protein WCV92_01920 [Candidatus Buchananbacteria bacterium]
MCKFFRREKSNHHFPELNKKKGVAKALAVLFGGSKMNYWAMGLMIVVGFIYFAQSNITATKGYMIKDMENQIVDLQEANAKLNLNYIQRQSMANIVGSASKMDLVPVSNVDVINANGAVALR